MHPRLESAGPSGPPSVTDNERETPQAAPESQPGGDRRAPWRALTFGDITFLSWVLLLALGTGFLLTMAGSPHTSTSSPKASSSATATTAPSATVAPSNAAATVRAAQAKVYPMPNVDAGLMQPAVDQQGNIWVGEMTLNKLARLVPRSGKLSEWMPPNGNYNIMETAVDAGGHIWFTEQASNYIGRFDPKTETFKTYPLGKVNGHSAGPQDLQFDGSGNLWFTELTGGRIGRLDPASGNIHAWTIPAPRPDAQSYPYSLAVTSGGDIWFGYLTGGAVGRLDPASGKVTAYTLANASAAVFAMAPDANGHIWFTEMQPARLGRIDTRTNAVSEMAVPNKLGDPATLYAVKVAKNGDVWFASAGANAIVRYRPSANNFLFYQLATTQSIPYGLDLDTAGHIWFSADGGSGNYVGMVAP
jgi:virginiamycin B lyase